jgi:5-methylcytosine-specific restriction protein A
VRPTARSARCIVFQRDPAVRAHVVKRANGRCEYCGRRGFLLPNGNHYVEAHHIIALAKQGPDTLENVIALCPEHHREAHFGSGAESLEQECLQLLAKILRSKEE